MINESESESETLVQTPAPLCVDEFDTLRALVFSIYEINQFIGQKDAAHIIWTLKECMREIKRNFPTLRKMFIRYIHEIVVISIVNTYKDDYPACLTLLYTVMIGARDIFHRAYLAPTIIALRELYEYDDVIIVAPFIAYIMSHPANASKVAPIHVVGALVPVNDRITKLIMDASNNPRGYLKMFRASAARIYEQI
jgi:hypothetical protein